MDSLVYCMDPLQSMTMATERMVRTGPRTSTFAMVRSSSMWISSRLGDAALIDALCIRFVTFSVDIEIIYEF